MSEKATTKDEDTGGEKTQFLSQIVYTYLLTALVFLPSLSFGEPPWGKDADLVTTTPPKKQSAQQPFLQVISFHQHVITQADGPRSHFYPSSSEYGRQAIIRHGPGLGLLLTFDRLLRENSDRWVYKVYYLKSGVPLKYDPVPYLQ